ncbi:MAG TPA: acyl-CoA thioesterase domain-containing protein [Actinocrinis sp.]
MRTAFAAGTATAARAATTVAVDPPADPAVDPPANPAAVANELIGLLDLAAVDPDGSGGAAPLADPLINLVGVFEGRPLAAGRGRAFGGLIAAQALTAAGRTVTPDRSVHSLRGYFTRRGNARTPIAYRVENLRDDQSASTRRVTAIQADVPVFFLTATFHAPGTGPDHQAPPPPAPPPNETPAIRTAGRAHAEAPPDELGALMRSPFDVRYPGRAAHRGADLPTGRGDREPQRAWLRVAAPLPDDPLLHAGVLTYLSDMGLLDSVLVEHGQMWGPGGYAGVSIDHAVWFHRPCRADDWLLWTCRSPGASTGRGLATGRLYTADGRLVMTVAQEGVVRRASGRGSAI